MTLNFRWLTLNRLVWLFIVILTAAAFQKFLIGQYNNYLMFARPFACLLQHQSMYVYHPELYDDLYKYSPVFAWLMAPLYYLPNWLGVLLWNLLNAAGLVIGVWYYLADEPYANAKRRIVLSIILLEALITAQNMQSNNLIVGMMLLGIYCLRTQRVWLAALLFTLCLYFKFYGVGAAVFFLFYPKKIQFIAAMVVCTVVLAFLPLTIISFSELVAEYQAWFNLIVISKLGKLISLLGILVSWFGMGKTDTNFRIVEGIGATLFLLPLLRFSLWSDRTYQQLMVAFFLVFVIIFNKMAESPTYILAVTGVALWWIASPERTTLDKILLASVIILTSLSPTDLFPTFLQKKFLTPYSIKALPCVLVWLRIQWQLWTYPAPILDETKAVLLVERS